VEFRYLGFDQAQNARAYRYDVIAKGDPTRQFTVTVDVALFLVHRIGIQEGPSLCARKLASDLENHADGTHELTVDDLRAYADERDAAETRRLEARRNGVRRSKPVTPSPASQWRSAGR
jgi:hypothetical protein